MSSRERAPPPARELAQPLEVSIAMVLMLLAFSPQRPGSQTGKLGFRLVPAVAVLSALFDWGLVLMAVYPIHQP